MAATPVQDKALKFIIDYQREHENSPTLRKIAGHLWNDETRTSSAADVVFRLMHRKLVWRDEDGNLRVRRQHGEAEGRAD